MGRQFKCFGLRCSHFYLHCGMLFFSCFKCNSDVKVCRNITATTRDQKVSKAMGMSGHRSNQRQPDILKFNYLLNHRDLGKIVLCSLFSFYFQKGQGTMRTLNLFFTSWVRYGTYKLHVYKILQLWVLLILHTDPSASNARLVAPYIRCVFK